MNLKNIFMFPLAPIILRPEGEKPILVFADVINEEVFGLMGDAYPLDHPVSVEVLHNIREEKKEADVFLSSEEIAAILHTREVELTKVPKNARET